MKLTHEEKAMRAGEMGQAAGEALAQQMKVGAFFHAADFVPVRTVHVMADIEALADPGLRFLEETAAGGGRFRVPVTTNPRSVDFALWREVGQEEEEMIKERRIVDALTGDGRASLQHLHQLSDRGPSQVRRTPGLGRYGHRDLCELGCRRQVQFRGGSRGRVGRAHRPGAALWVPSAREAAGVRTRGGGRSAPHEQRLGRARMRGRDARWATTGRYRYSKT